MSRAQGGKGIGTRRARQACVVVRGVHVLLCLLLVVLVAPGPVDARPPARTPAGVERRRAEVVERLAAIEAEVAAVDDRLTGLPAREAAADERSRATLVAERVALQARRGALLDEQAALQKEQAELALLRTRTATGPLQPLDPRGLSPLGPGAQNAQVSSGQSFNPAISVIPDIAYYHDDVAGDAFEVLELQRQDLPLLAKQRPLRAWEKISRFLTFRLTHF